MNQFAKRLLDLNNKFVDTENPDLEASGQSQAQAENAPEPVPVPQENPDDYVNPKTGSVWQAPVSAPTSAPAIDNLLPKQNPKAPDQGDVASVTNNLNKTYQQQLMDLLNPEENKKRVDELSKASQQALAEQKAGIVENQADIQKYKNMNTGVDINPFLNYVDNLTGSTLQKGYAAPLTPEEKQKQLIALKQALQTEKGAYSDKQIQLLKDQLGANSNASLAKLLMGGQRVGMREDALALQFGNSVEKNPVMVQLTKQSQAIDRGIDSLHTKGYITPELFNEIQMDLSRAISGGGVVGEAMQSRVDAPEVGLTFAKLLEKYGNKPHDVRKESPEVVAAVEQTLQRLRGSYGDAQAKYFDQLISGLDFANTPAAKKVLDAKREAYLKNATESHINRGESAPAPVRTSKPQKAAAPKGVAGQPWTKYGGE